MSLDLDKLPPDRKLALIAVGEEFGSDDTFAQATQTLQGLEKHAGTLKLYGLPASDAERLGDARGLLSAAGYGRNEAKSKKKTLGADLDEAQKAARTLRLRARSVLTSTRSGLLEQGEKQAAAEVQAALDATSDSDTTGEDLPRQLEQLAAALDPQKAPKAAAVAADRGGPETLPPLAAAAATLRDAHKKKPTVRGTPEETQRLDLIDGLIVDICRRARAAAEAASKSLGDPALLRAFKLDKLYAPRSGGAKKEESGGEGAGVEAGTGVEAASTATQSSETKGGGA